MKKLFSFNLDQNLREKLEKVAKQNSWSLSLVIEHALIAYCEEFKDVPKVEKVPVEKQTEEERLADWEWRKQMVKDGKLPAGMEQEYPNTLAMESKDTSEFTSQN